MNGGELTRELVEASAAFGERTARAERFTAAIRRHGGCRPVVVGAVAADARYLTTHASTRSEIVVPVFARGVPVGLIDVETARPLSPGLGATSSR